MYYWVKSVIIAKPVDGIKGAVEPLLTTEHNDGLNLLVIIEYFKR